MAIIYSYPQINLSSISADDLMIISDMNADGRPTKSLTLKNLADFVTSTGTGTGTTNKIIKWSDGPAGLLGDSIMTENATQIDLAGTFLSTSSPTATSGPVHAIRADQSTTTGGAFNIALYGDTKHTGATQANSNYGIYTKAEFEGTGGYTGIILGGTFEGRYDGSGTNGANASLYGTFSKANVTGASSGDIQYMIGSNVTSEMSSGTTTDVEFLQGQHTNVTLNSGNVSGDIAVNILDFDYTAGTLQGDFAYLQIQNDPVPTPSSGTARAINSDSTLPSHFSGQVEVPLIPTSNPHATSKQYVDTQIASIPAGLVFKGNWDANANSPTLASGTGTVGNYYVVSVAGNTNLDGITDWEVGDWAVFVEVGGVDKWDKIDQTFVQGAGATGQVSFWNGVNSVTGDNAFFWDNTNKRLGIGTTSPGYSLEVRGTADQSLYLAKTGTTYLRATAGTNAELFTGGSMILGSGNTERIRITSSGDVGIGTSSPTQKLDVVGRAIITRGGEVLRFNSPDPNGSFVTWQNNSSSIGYIGAGYHMWASPNNIATSFGIRAQTRLDLGIQADVYMTILSSGNVGIGTASPAAKLDVVGRIGLNDGNNNVSVGDLAGDALTTGNNNTVVGYYALSAETLGDRNVALGAYALHNQNNTSDTDVYNVAIGYQAGLNVTTGTDNTIIGGLAGDELTTGALNVAIGKAALSSEDTGSASVAVGHAALMNQDGSGAVYNTAVGHNAGTNITTGERNTIIGSLAGDAMTSASYSVAIGYEALSSEDTGNQNVAVGYRALKDLDAGVNANNVAVGYLAGENVTTGVENAIVGSLAGDAITTGSYNAVLGTSALGANRLSSANVAIGNSALASHDLGVGTSGYNVAVGFNAGVSVTTGTHNTIIGALAGDSLTTAANNVVLGYSALSAETGSTSSVAIGTEALKNQNVGSGSAYNVAIGDGAGKEITSALYNTLVGGQAGDAITIGSQNTAVGTFTLSANQEGRKNVAIGYGSLNSMNPSSASDTHNIAIGYHAGLSVTTGVFNTLIGGVAGDALTTGTYNTAIGYQALGSEDTFGFNVAVGAFALLNQNAADNAHNVAVGYAAGENVTTGVKNTLIGGVAGQALTSGDNNVALGYKALNSETIGNGSVAIGAFALEDQQSGAGAIILNTAVGYEAGKNIDGNPGNGDQNTAIGGKALDAETTGQENTAVGVDALGGQTGADNNTALGWRAGYTTTTGSNVTLLGYNALASTGTVSNEITLGDTNVTALRCAVTSITSLSDERDKSDIKDLTYGLELIDSLKPKEFVWDNRAEIDAEGNEFYSANKGKKDFGFIAQEVKELDNDTLRLIYDENPERLEMSYGKLVPILVKAIQELSAEVKILKNK